MRYDDYELGLLLATVSLGIAEKDLIELWPDCLPYLCARCYIKGAGNWTRERGFRWQLTEIGAAKLEELQALWRRSLRETMNLHNR